MKIGEIRNDGLLYEKALELRYFIFFKEHNLSNNILNDEMEERSIHIAISQDDELIAYGRLSALINEEFQISQMVVSPNYQSQGYGVKLLLVLMRTAKNRGAKTIVLNARTSAIGFYVKQGFQQVGQVYNSCSTGVPHIKMVHHTNT
jgi:predicted GNAT family N-acyltransferase